MAGKVTKSALLAGYFSTFAIAIPADPTITTPAVLPRQNNDRFIGWAETDGTWYSETCNAGLTWYQSGQYGQCCPATLTACPAPTACVSGSMIYPFPALSTTTTIACTLNFGNASYSICNTAFIFENMQDSNPKTDIVCGEASVNWSYYRKIPATLTDVSSNAALSRPQPVSTALLAPGNTNSNSGGGDGGGSKAWIAGAVIGPIVGLGLIGALIWFCLRRKRSKDTAPQQGGAAMAAMNPSQPPAGVAGYTDAKPQFTQQQQPAFPPNQYNNQGAFVAQPVYNNAPVSPPPQHSPSPAPYNTNTAPYNAGTAPYNPPVSPAPQQDHYTNDVKHGYTAAPHDGAAELGGMAGGPVPVTHSPPAPQAAELGGYSQPGGAGSSGPSELPSPHSSTRLGM